MYFQGFLIKRKERVMGIEPTYPAWKAGVLPLNYTRISVGVTGFEPATSWSQTRRSSQAEPHPVGVLCCRLLSVPQRHGLLYYMICIMSTLFLNFLTNCEQTAAIICKSFPKMGHFLTCLSLCLHKNGVQNKIFSGK